MTKDNILRFRITEEVLNMRLEELDLSQRAMNCLHRCKCETVEDVIDIQKILPTVNGCGLNTIKEIKNKIFEAQLVVATANM